MTTDIDWSKKPAPQCWIGPSFRADCQRIMGQIHAPPARLPDHDGIEFQARLIRAKMSQSELARRVGLSTSTISHLVNGRGSVSAETWQRIDDVLEEATRVRFTPYPR